MFQRNCLQDKDIIRGLTVDEASDVVVEASEVVVELSDEVILLNTSDVVVEISEVVVESSVVLEKVLEEVVVEVDEMDELYDYISRILPASDR